MKKLLLILIWSGSLIAMDGALAQSTRAVANSITCPVAGSSTQVLAAAASRQSYILSNTSGITIRLGFLATGTANLTDSNSIKVLAGQVFSDDVPGIFIGRIVCMSDSGATAAVYVIETRRP
jgi:hypothetical protein